MNRPLPNTQLGFMLEKLEKAFPYSVWIDDLRQEWFEKTGQWSDLQIRHLTNKYGISIETGNVRANQTLTHNPALQRGEYRLCK
tara:strand:+ start:278 stop:529 length:252 start_codon:yes stop_codon:yes gene_type:complete